MSYVDSSTTPPLFTSAESLAALLTQRRVQLKFYSPASFAYKTMVAARSGPLNMSPSPSSSP